MPSSKGLLSNILVTGIAVFAASVCVMVLELVAGRLAARQFGSSLYTWTSVIGVTLAGITIGAYLGGRIADISPTRRTLSRLFAACSGACILAVFMNNVISEWTYLWQLAVSARVFTHITIVFFIPAMLMGVVIPVAIRIALVPNLLKGHIVGRMYALGSAGSIIGTFLAGFWLIAALGTLNTLWLLAGIMLVLAVAYLPKSLVMYAYAAPLAFLIIIGTASANWAQNFGVAIRLRQPNSPNILYETESQYCYIAVRQVTEHPDERQFIEDNLKNHSRLIMGRIRNLRLFYCQVYGAVTDRLAKNKGKLSTLSIGGGGYVFPRYILDVWPESRVDVVEIDPAVTEAAIKAFGLSENSPIRTITLDGRNYIDGLLEKKGRDENIQLYDFVYMDAFNDMTVPFQLTTRQFNEKIFEITTDDGVYIINLIDLSENGSFFASFIKTISRTFPNLHAIKRPLPEGLPTNYVVIAAKQEVNLEGLGNEKHLAGIPVEILDESDLKSLVDNSDLTILNDDHAPVENLMAPVVKSAAAVEMSEKYCEQAQKLDSDGKWEKALRKCRAAIEACPPWSGKAYYLMGKILAKRGRLADAVEALNSALLKIDENHDRVSAASLHFNIGVFLYKLGQTEKAYKHLIDANDLLHAQIEDSQGHAELFWYLARVKSAIGNQEEAIRYYRQAVDTDPNEILYQISAVEALADNGQLDEAIMRANEGIDLMLNQGRNEDAEQLKELIRLLEIEK